MERRKWERITATFLAVQAAAVLAWWAWILSDASTRTLFLGPNLPPRSLDVFLIPDSVTYVGLGLLALWTLTRGNRWAWPLLILHAGAVLYATCATVALAYQSGGGWLGVGLMSANAAALTFLAWKLKP